MPVYFSKKNNIFDEYFFIFVKKLMLIRRNEKYSAGDKILHIFSMQYSILIKVVHAIIFFINHLLSVH